MKQDVALTNHNCSWEKVLGHRYEPRSDSISLNQRICDPELNTKRLILSAAFSVFDPLSLCLPVTVQGRLLIREMWIRGIDWDEPIPEELQHRWRLLAGELSELHSISFDRQGLSEYVGVDLLIFSDASKKAYGFSVYAVGRGSSSLIFAKAKVAPLKTKTLPTLELLAVFLAIKCLSNILKTYQKMTFRNLYLAVDAQIVLSWLLSKQTNNKSIFVKHRLKDITQMEE